MKVNVDIMDSGEMVAFILGTLPWHVALLKKMPRQCDESRLQRGGPMTLYHFLCPCG